MNRDEDYAIISARKGVLEAQEALDKYPGPQGALRVQREKRAWDALKALSLVKVPVLLLVLCLSAPAFAGPQCTYTYPRGYNVTNYRLVKVKKHLKVLRVLGCMNGEFGATWRSCELRYRA